jgi:hypothetical protein
VNAVAIMPKARSFLTFVEVVAKTDHGEVWRCKCECGETTVVRADSVKSGRTKSCGCYHLKCASARNWKHGLTGTPMHNLWGSMISRCENPKHEAYENYGGRGIKVCERWHDFVNFNKDVGPRPSPSHSLDRIDNSGNYEPGNCRWATTRQQCRNTRVNRMLTFKGRTLCVISWAEEVNKPVNAIYCRLDRGWTTEDALTRPLRVTKRPKPKGSARAWRVVE